MDKKISWPCSICCGQTGPEYFWWIRSEEAIFKNPTDVGVRVCPQCAEKLLNQGYRLATAKSGHRMICKR